MDSPVAMRADSSAYSFPPATIEDLPRFRRWLRAPEAKRWWGEPREQIELLRSDLNEPRMTMRIVSFNGRPFAYAQDYEVHAWPQTHLAHLPQGSRAIDSFIGWPSMIGRGHGQAYLRLLAERLCTEGAPLSRSIRRKTTFARVALMKRPGFASQDWPRPRRTRRS